MSSIVTDIHGRELKFTIWENKINSMRWFFRRKKIRFSGENSVRWGRMEKCRGREKEMVEKLREKRKGPKKTCNLEFNNTTTLGLRDKPLSHKQNV